MENIEEVVLTPDEIDRAVLEILAGQSPVYLIQPHATAFILVGLKPGLVEESLIRHWGEQSVDHITTTEVYLNEEDEELPVLDENENEVVVDQGWAINKKGKTKLKELRKEEKIVGHE